ncbi:hypothetical protein TNCV_4957981 [Trichonephila clavipes]|nr:hypothetical protein TNCV_4957981 [Trichonephila clavipes]
MSNGGLRNSSYQNTRCTLVVSRSFEHHSDDSTFCLGSPPILRDNISPPSTNLKRGLAARRLFRVYPWHKDTKHLQTSRPYDTTVSVANRYTGLGLGSNSREVRDVCKYIVPLRHGGTLNSRQAESPLVRLGEQEESWEAPDHP